MRHPGWKTVTLHRRAVTGRDEFGDDVYGVALIDVPGCSVQPRINQTLNVERDFQVVSGVSLYAPETPVITSADVVEIDGRKYEVEGEPGMWQTLNGTQAYQQVSLKRVTG